MLKARVCSACCAKKNTSNSQNKSKTPEEFEDRCRTSQHMNAVSAEMLQRDSLFQRTLDEREIVAEDVLLKVFTAAYCMDHENELQLELPNHKIKSHSVSPRAYMYSRFGGL